MIYFSRKRARAGRRLIRTIYFMLFFSLFCLNTRLVLSADIHHDMTSFDTAMPMSMTAGFDDVALGSYAPYVTDGVLIRYPLDHGHPNEHFHEVRHESVDWEQPFWFNNSGSPPNFIFAFGGFMATFPVDVLGAGFEYAGWEGDGWPGETSFQWTLYSDRGEIIDQGLEPADGFAGGFEANYFFGVVSHLPFRSIAVSRVSTDGSAGSKPWVADQIRWSPQQPGAPVADAGEDRIVGDEVTLDGGGSFDHDGAIVSYVWHVLHREDPTHDRYVLGVNPILSNLEPGFYDVRLTVYDNDRLTKTDTMTLAVAGDEPTVHIETEELNVSRLTIFRENFFGNSFIEFSGMFNTLGVDLSEGEYAASVAIQIKDVLDNNAELILSNEIILEAHDLTFGTFLFWVNGNQ